MKNLMEKIKKISFSSWPKYSKKEINIVKKIIESGKVNYWTGHYCRLFEKKFKLKFNYKEMIMLDSYKNIIKVLNKKLKK